MDGCVDVSLWICLALCISCIYGVYRNRSISLF